MFPDNSGSPRTSHVSGCAIENNTMGQSAPDTVKSSLPAEALDIRSIGISASKQFATGSADDTRRSMVQLITTLTPFLALLGAMVATAETAYWATLLLAVPAAGLLVRLFIFQHDCGHGS
ncbi:MAG: hypothetical protein MJA82_11565, partial [Clostridia bacterium]|nr:hypothetical protein [Clostridia bacterium]